jgi:hypothetical protein
LLPQAKGGFFRLLFALNFCFSRSTFRLFSLITFLNTAASQLSFLGAFFRHLADFFLNSCSAGKGGFFFGGLPPIRFLNRLFLDLLLSAYFTLAARFFQLFSFGAFCF